MTWPNKAEKLELQTFFLSKIWFSRLGVERCEGYQTLPCFGDAQFIINFTKKNQCSPEGLTNMTHEPSKAGSTLTSKRAKRVVTTSSIQARQWETFVNIWYFVDHSRNSRRNVSKVGPSWNEQSVEKRTLCLTSQFFKIWAIKRTLSNYSLCGSPQKSKNSSDWKILPWPTKSLQPRYSWDWSAVRSCDIMQHRLQSATRACDTQSRGSRRRRTEARYRTISYDRTVGSTS